MSDRSIGKPLSSLLPQLDASISRSQRLLLTHQFLEGYWWYTLEANESIGAEYILLMEFLGIPDPKTQRALCERILQKQRNDGSWALYHGGPGELGASIECYWVLKLCGYPTDHPALKKARSFIVAAGGPTKARVFTKIHLAMFGLIPWHAAPAMPLELILLPSWAPVNIYEFSSWARACIVPLLAILNERPVHPLKMDLEELFPEPKSKRSWEFVHNSDGFSLENTFIYLDKFIKNIRFLNKISPTRFLALKAVESYIREHIAKTEDIYPALAYGAMALKTMGYDMADPTIAKAVRALQSFQQPAETELPPIPRKISPEDPPQAIHQQCCISPVWDTPWTALSLLESGLAANHPALQKAADWLLDKQILETRGDWAVKNKKGVPGGWAFEFENDYFPDVDDTIEVLMFLFKRGLNTGREKKSFERGLEWLLSMQSKNGGWAAFDMDNTLQWVNRIPFSDHGACLDPPTPDITGRMLEFLALIGHPTQDPLVRKAVKFIYRTQLPCGAWEGRWGVNYLYGTWAVLKGLIAIGEQPDHPAVVNAVQWLEDQQNQDGGWGESCEGYLKKKFVRLYPSVPSQTAWALMGLIAAGRADSTTVTQGMEFLFKKQNRHGCWDEENYTGTGFPGHFYIRYHGYRHYFPLLALGEYRRAVARGSKESSVSPMVSSHRG
jgi:squalene-hopene/tetraprenyl-beta-curcumene cyclase